jgi:hypothetical protein
MGRTVLPFSHGLESERERWKSFRRALSKKNREALDRLFDRAKFHTSNILPPFCRQTGMAILAFTLVKGLLSLPLLID